MRCPAEIGSDLRRTSRGAAVTSLRGATPDEALARRGAILEAVRLAAESFLDPAEPWEAKMPQALIGLAQATGTSRVYLFENYRWDGDGEVWATQRFEWAAPGVRSIADDPTLLAMPYRGIGFGRWVERFQRGETVHGLRRDFRPVEQVQLTADETLSIAVVPITVEGRWWGMIGFDECAFERVWTEAELDALRAAASTIATAIRASRAEEALRGRVRALAAVAESLTVDQPLATTLSRLAATVVEASRATACSVQLVDPATEGLESVHHHGLPDGYPEALAELWRSDVETPIVTAVRRQESLWVPDARDMVLADDVFGPLQPLMPLVEWTGMLVVPLDPQRRNLGGLCVYYPPGVEVDDGERAFLRALADQAAAAVENARLYTAVQRSAALEERQRLARELHDSVSQALYGIALGAKTARQVVDRGPEALVEPLDYVVGLAEAGLAEMRALIFELRPEALEAEGLVAALDRQLRAVRARHQIDVTAALGPEPDLPIATKEALYRIAQEALHNVVKHADATAVTVTLGVDGGRLALVIVDDGVGFDPTADYPGHLGLRSMRERAVGVGAELGFTSAPGEGARLEVRIACG